MKAWNTYSLVDLLQIKRSKVELKDAMQEAHLQLFESLEIHLSQLEFLEPKLLELLSNLVLEP
jgi:hypothetical protein